MTLSPYVIELLSKQCARPIHIPSDCEYLSLDIQSKLGIRIGATTLKRLLGFVADERQPHASTLDAIARYLGYTDWQQLALEDEKGNSGFEVTDEEIRSADLVIGINVEIKYSPGRTVVFGHLGDSQFKVLDSQNSKLQAGDLASIQNFILHHPLFISSVIRDGKDLGQFTAGRVSGLSSIRVYK